jgi:hypothetical protein
VTSRTTANFRRRFATLPARIQEEARRAYRLFQTDPDHPSLRYKPVHPKRPIYSVRVGRDYRAVGIREENEMIWFWIGPHADYDRLLAQWKRRKPRPS